MRQLDGKRVVMWGKVLETLREEHIIPRVVVHAIKDPNIVLPAKQMGDVRVMYRHGHRTLDILYGEVRNKIHVKSIEVAD
jgi:hypothetical protein